MSPPEIDILTAPISMVRELRASGQIDDRRWSELLVERPELSDTPGLEAAWEERSRGREEMPAIAAHVVNGPWRLGHGGTIVCTNAKIGGEAKLFDVRGWGYLTGGGHGALGLSYEEGAKVQDRMAAIAIAAPEMLAALLAIKPYLGAIICYASTVEEHEPNRIAVMVEAAIAKATTSPQTNGGRDGL